MKTATATLPAAPAASHSLFGRSLSLAYGLGTYGLFLGTFVYVMLFVLGWFVPTTIAGGREASLYEWLIFEEEYWRAGAPLLSCSECRGSAPGASLGGRGRGRGPSGRRAP